MTNFHRILSKQFEYFESGVTCDDAKMRASLTFLDYVSDEFGKVLYI